MIFGFRMAMALLLFPGFATAQVAPAEVRSGDPRLTFPSVDELPEVRELPNPFVFLDGTAVKTHEDWVRRRAEMKAMVLHYQFGHAPALPAPDTIVADLVRRGYMLVSYQRTDLHPDWGKDPEAKKRRDRGDARRAYPDHDWGCLRVWAWGGSVTINWLSTLPEVDMTKIVCTGHSRGGQTAALMGMMDERVAVVAPNAGGSITTGCHRVGNGTRRIKDKMNGSNAYWFHPNLIPFGDQETRLPFDLHFIKAAVAPRAWFNANGLSDKLNVEGSMVTWRAARVVYEWLGVKERCAQWYREGGHDQGEQDWKALAEFADFILFDKRLPNPKAFYQEPWPDIPLNYSWKAPSINRR